MTSLFPLPDQPQVTFPTDYPSILERVEKIDPLLYGKTRNFVDGAVTYLSPYISRGVISVKQVQERILAKGYPPAAIEKFLQELAWREYFQRVWQAKGEALFADLKQPQADVQHTKMISALVEASTGIEAIDKAIKLFYETGYLHNHVRMYVASIACNIGKGHWHMPAKWMYYHLLDGDLASNSCSWQWVAGAFASKKYYCNQENINRYTYSHQQNTFLDVPTYTLPTLPIPASLRHTTNWNETTLLPTLPIPAIDIIKPTFIYNAYNLDPLWHQGEDGNRILLLEPSHFKQYPVSTKVIDFVIKLSRNIANCQVLVGEVTELANLYEPSPLKVNGLVSKEHPAFVHYPGIKEPRDWLYPSVSGYHSSFFSYWKQCQKQSLMR